MGISVSKKKFVSDIGSSHGVIDLSHKSAALEAAITETGADPARLEEIAGVDLQIEGDTEMKKLYEYVASFEPKSASAKKKSLAVTELAPDGSEVLTKAGRLYSAFKDEAAANRLDPKYGTPGKTAAAEQTPLTVAGDALIVSAADQAKLPPVSLPVKGLNQFKYGPTVDVDGDIACYVTARAQAEKYTSKIKSDAKLLTPGVAIQIAYAEDKAGRLAIDPTQAAIGREYIDAALDKGLPVVVGVSYADKAYNVDKMTDHFVTIYGRDYDSAGRLFYMFKDPGAGGRDGKLFVDADSGKLFKEGDKKTGYVESADYEVTQVLTYDSLP